MNNIDLKPHQKKPIEFIKHHHGLIVWHSTGSGKTITSLVGMYQFNRPIVIIGPKSSKKAFSDEIDKLKLNKKRISFYSFTKIKIMLPDDIEFFRDKCVIVDEAHHLRNDTRDIMVLRSALSLCYKIMLLTATPVINYLNDISSLVNLAKNKDIMPSDNELFNFLFFNEIKLEIQNEEILREKFKNCISYYEKKDDPNYPKTETFVKKIKMDDKQIKEYEKYIIKLIYEGKKPTGIDIFNINFDTLKKKKKNAFLTATRQISNSIDGSIDTPKVTELFKIIKDGPFPIVVYSNFLQNGIYPIAKLLSSHNMSFKMITGSTSSDNISNIVDDYNAGIYKILLLSSAGSESLDLKNTRQIHIMEPHWNEAKINQVIGRAVRYKSHISLLPTDRTVTIYRWISVFPEHFLNESADEYLTKISLKKKRIFSEFKKIMIESAIEFNNKDGGKNKSGKNKNGDNQYEKYKRKYLELKKLKKLQMV